MNQAVYILTLRHWTGAEFGVGYVNHPCGVFTTLEKAQDAIKGMNVSDEWEVETKDKLWCTKSRGSFDNYGEIRKVKLDTFLMKGK